MSYRISSGLVPNTNPLPPAGEHGWCREPLTGESYTCEHVQDDATFSEDVEPDAQEILASIDPLASAKAAHAILTPAFDAALQATNLAEALYDVRQRAMHEAEEDIKRIERKIAKLQRELVAASHLRRKAVHALDEASLMAGHARETEAAIAAAHEALTRP